MPSVRPGSQLDHYAFEELVARSDTASIFRGTDPRTGRKVAIKFRIERLKVTRSSISAFVASRKSVKSLTIPP
jgi:hypothetical protein